MRKYHLVIELNEPQHESFERLRRALRGSDHADITVRKDGGDQHFEADWLRDSELIPVITMTDKPIPSGSSIPITDARATVTRLHGL